MAEADGLLSVQWIPLDQLRPNPANPRRHGEAIQKVADSIQHFGWRQPIVVSKQDNMIEAGHARWEAAKRLGLQEVPVVFFDDDPVMAAAFNIADNRARDFSEWDNDALASLLVSLQSEDALLETGFTDADLDELLGTITEPAEETFDVAEALESGVEPRIQRGEVWQLGRHRLLCGDSTSAEDVEKLMGGEKAQLIWTDPPYGVKYGDKLEAGNPMGYRVRTIANDDLPAEELEGFIRAVFRNVAFHCRPGAAIYAACPAGTLLPAAIAAFEDSGFVFRWQLVWLKDQLVLSRADYHFKHENILYGWKDDGAHYFSDDRTQTSVFAVDRPKRSPEHPTMKPIELIVAMIRNSSRLGDLVVDPFLGSGSTLMASGLEGRICYGMEIEPQYCEVSIQRWEDYTGQQAVKIG